MLGKSIRKHQRTAAIAALLFAFIFALLYALSSTAYASLSDSPNISTSTVYNSKYDTNVTSATVNNITFQQTLTLYPDSNGNYKGVATTNYISDAENIIYLDENFVFSSSLVGSDDFVFNFYNNTSLGFYKTERYGNNAHGGSDVAVYAVQDRTQTESKFKNGDYLEYGNQYSGTPAFDITIKNAGYTSDGRYVNVVITFQYIYVERNRDTLSTDYDPYPCFIHFYDGYPITFFTIESGQDYSAYEIDIAFYYADTGEYVDDASLPLEVHDLDTPEFNADGTANRSGQYSESIWFIDGITNTVELTKSPDTYMYVARDTYTSGSGVSYSSLARLYSGVSSANTDYQETVASGFITEIEEGFITFLWTGRYCGSEINLSQADYITPPVDPPSKTVDKTEARLGDTLTYTITQFVPYTSADSAYSSLVFTDVIGSAFDINSATINVFRTDTLNGTTKRSDNSNWTTSINKQTNTITASHDDPENAGGTYEFVITVNVTDNANNLAGSETTTTFGGEPVYVVSNEAKFEHDYTTEWTEVVKTLVPTTPNIELVKTADVETIEDPVAGTSTITYTFLVTNTGETTLNNVTLTDPMLGGEVKLNSTTLESGGSTTGTATYTVTQADIDAGIVTNTATVTGEDPFGRTVTDEDTEDVNLWRLPAIDLVKEVVGDTIIEDAYAGDWVRFALIVTNTGNTTLYNATITDLLDGTVFVVEELEGVTFNADNVVVDVMLPGDVVTVYVDYQLTQADIDRGDTENIATVTADPPGDLVKVYDDDDELIKTPSVPDISLTKTVAPANGIANEDLTTGDELVYTLVITNTGNTTLSNIVLYDELLGGDIDLTNAVRGTVDTTTTDAVDNTNDTDVTDETVGDVVADNVENTNGDDDAGASILSSDVDTDAATDGTDDVDASLTDDGNNDAIGVEGGDVAETEDAEDDQTTITLSPGEYLLVEITYTITQDDMNNGRVDNTATVTAEDPNGNNVADEDTAVMYLPQHPEITLVKEATLETLVAASVGDPINYTLTITNTGDVSLMNLTLTDELEGIVIDTSVLDDLILAPGENVVVTAEYALTAVDLLTGSVYNHATVLAESVVPYDEENIWSGPQQVSDDDDVIVDGIVAVADDLIVTQALAQTGEELAPVLVSVFVGLITVTSITAGYIGKRRHTK